MNYINSGEWYVDNVVIANSQYMSARAYQKGLYTPQAMWQPLPPPRAEMGELFFIYGTLKKGHRNSHLLIPDQMKLIGAAVAQNFKLIELCNGVPAAVYNPYSEVYGELYDMGKDNLAIMERIEQGYERQTVEVTTNQGKCYAAIWAWPHSYNEEQTLPFSDWDLNSERLSYEVGFNKCN